MSSRQAIGMSTPNSIISDPWFDSKGLMNDEEPATPEEVQALKEFLGIHLSTSSAAKKIMILEESKTPLNGKDNRVAWLILDAMIHFPSSQSKLLDLVEAIPNLTDTDIGLNDQIKARYPEWQKWNSFDRFYGLVDEVRRSYWAYRYTPDEDDTNPKECHRRWSNINALLALEYQRGKEPRGWPTYGISVIRDGLEQERWKHQASAQGESTVKILDADVPAAVQWLLYAGTDLHRMIGCPDARNSIPPSDLYRDESLGLSKPRWIFWKTRLLWVSEQAELDDETQESAIRAYRKMVEIEESSAGS